MESNLDLTAEQIQDILYWTYSDTRFYYKDCDLEPSVLQQFHKDLLIRNGYFLDVSWKGGGLHYNTRFLIGSCKAAKLYEVNPANEKYGHCCINANCYFKVLDIYTIGDKTQIFLLHIPAQGVNYFSANGSKNDALFIDKAREQFADLISKPPVATLLEPFWEQRTNFPVGMDVHNQFYPLSKITPFPPGGEELYNGIRSLTNDKSHVNTPTL